MQVQHLPLHVKLAKGRHMSASKCRVISAAEEGDAVCSERVGGIITVLTCWKAGEVSLSGFFPGQDSSKAPGHPLPCVHVVICFCGASERMMF